MIVCEFENKDTKYPKEIFDGMQKSDGFKGKGTLSMRFKRKLEDMESSHRGVDMLVVVHSKSADEIIPTISLLLPFSFEANYSMYQLILDKSVSEKIIDDAGFDTKSMESHEIGKKLSEALLYTFSIYREDRVKVKEGGDKVLLPLSFPPINQHVQDGFTEINLDLVQHNLNHAVFHMMCEQAFRVSGITSSGSSKNGTRGIDSEIGSKRTHAESDSAATSLLSSSKPSRSVKLSEMPSQSNSGSPVQSLENNDGSRKSRRCRPGGNAW